MPVSKTDFVRGLQCPKMLWLDKHKPQEKIIPPEVAERLEEGNAFGDRAMSLFGEYVETTTFREDGRLNYSAMIKKTSECLEEGTPVICEAAFSYYGNYCAVDILKKTPSGYELYEVKNSEGIKEVFLQDVGFQKYILGKCGVKVTKVYIVTNSGREEDPYLITEVTSQAKKYEFIAYKKIREFGKLKNEKEEYVIPTGEQCETPYRCWYYEYCHREKGERCTEHRLV